MFFQYTIMMIFKFLRTFLMLFRQLVLSLRLTAESLCETTYHDTLLSLPEPVSLANRGTVGLRD